VTQQRLAESLPPPGPANAEQVDVARVRIDVVGLAERVRRELVSGVGFSCARTQSGRAYCWGYSRDGALGSGGASSPLPVTVQVGP